METSLQCPRFGSSKPDSKFHHIFNCKDCVVCMVCKENLNDNTSSNNSEWISNHLDSPKHLDNVKTLFETCFISAMSKDLNEKHFDIVHNSVFDVVLDQDKSSYVCKVKETFVCLICQVAVARSVDSADDITRDLLAHLGTDFHSNNLKDNVYWVYCLRNEKDILMFHKSILHCSVCSQNFEIMGKSLLKTAVEHLHFQVQRSCEVEKVVNADSKVEKLCNKLECWRISQTNLHLLDSSDSFSDDLDFSDCRSSLLDSENELTDEESFDDEFGVCDTTLTCPECGEAVEIYNDNAEFSMDLHSHKHKDLKSINVELSYQENADYMCPICSEKITIFNKNLNLSVSLHFEDKKHEYGELPQTDFHTSKSYFDLLGDVFYRLPINYQVHRSVFTISENEILCKLCSCRILSTEDSVESICEAVRDHVMTSLHEELRKVPCRTLTSAVVNYNIQPKTNNISSTVTDDTFEKLSRELPLINNNKQFISKGKINYFCNLCKKHIGYSPKESILKINFVSHLKGNCHRSSVKLLQKMKTTTCVKRKTEKKSVAENFPLQFSSVSLNQNFIVAKDGTFFCKLCPAAIEYSELDKHCQSLLHNAELWRKILLFLSNQEEYKKPSKKFQKHLKPLSRSIVLQPHTHFITRIDKENVFCFICKETVPFCGQLNRIKGHFFSAKHRKCILNSCFGKEDKKKFESFQSSYSFNHKGKETTQKPVVVHKPSSDVFKINPTNQVSSSTNTKNQSQEAKRLQERANKLLNNFFMYLPRFFKYESHILVKEGNFYCNQCKETILCRSSGKPLKNHLKDHEKYEKFTS